MPLFYFDIETRGSFTLDEEGHSFPDAEIAKREAANARQISVQFECSVPARGVLLGHSPESDAQHILEGS
jgi:hypothetical protein